MFIIIAVVNQEDGQAPSSSVPASKAPLPTIDSVDELVDLSVLKTNRLFNISLLNQWDYPIFDLAAQFPTTILSMV